MKSHTVVLAGELVAFNDQGRPRFSRIQDRVHVADARVAARRATANPVVYQVFDLLHLDGQDLATRPYEERRERLAKLVADGPHWRVSRHYVDDGAALLEAARANQLEGVMAKRLDSLYRPGKRSPSWITMCRPQGSVIDVVDGVRSALLGYVDDLLRAGVNDVAG